MMTRILSAPPLGLELRRKPGRSQSHTNLPNTPILRNNAIYES
jgi:hypothetical protein